MRRSSHLPRPSPLLALFRSVVSPPCPPASALGPHVPPYSAARGTLLRPGGATSLFRSLMAFHPLSPCLLVAWLGAPSLHLSEPHLQSGLTVVPTSWSCREQSWVPRRQTLTCAWAGRGCPKACPWISFTDGKGRQRGQRQEWGRGTDRAPTGSSAAAVACRDVARWAEMTRPS